MLFWVPAGRAGGRTTTLRHSRRANAPQTHMTRCQGRTTVRATALGLQRGPLVKAEVATIGIFGWPEPTEVRHNWQAPLTTSSSHPLVSFR